MFVPAAGPIRVCFSLVEALDSEAAELYDIGFLFAAVVRSPCTGALEGADEARGLDGRNEKVELVAGGGLADDGVVGVRGDDRGGAVHGGVHGGSAVSLVVERDGVLVRLAVVDEVLLGLHVLRAGLDAVAGAGARALADREGFTHDLRGVLHEARVAGDDGLPAAMGGGGGVDVVHGRLGRCHGLAAAAAAAAAALPPTEGAGADHHARSERELHQGHGHVERRREVVCWSVSVHCDASRPLEIC